jgi:hypothetical protein
MTLGLTYEKNQAIAHRGVVVQVVQSSGVRGAVMPIAFFGEDRAVVTAGADVGQSVEFVRDAAGRVQWVRVTGRVAVRVK